MNFDNMMKTNSKSWYFLIKMIKGYFLFNINDKYILNNTPNPVAIQFLFFFIQCYGLNWTSFQSLWGYERCPCRFLPSLNGLCCSVHLTRHKSLLWKVTVTRRHFPWILSLRNYLQRDLITTQLLNIFSKKPPILLMEAGNSQMHTSFKSINWLIIVFKVSFTYVLIQ